MRGLPMLLLAGLSASAAFSQTLITRPATTAVPQPEPPQTIQLTVPAGTPLKVVVDRETRVRKTEQLVEGKLIAPVYAFDKLVVPAGTKGLCRVRIS